MGNLLQALLADSNLPPAATLATFATSRPKVATVATVATVASPAQKTEAVQEAFEERAAILEFEAGHSRTEAERLAGELVAAEFGAWPHSDAMSAAEVELFTRRVWRFKGKGLNADEAERVADGLVRRDREGDDRRLCIECRHLSNGGCGNWQAAGMTLHPGSAQLSRELWTLPQRCPGFAPAIEGAAHD